MVTLRREGVELRTPAVSDADALVAAVRSSLDSLAPWMPWATPTYDVAAADAWLADIDEHAFVIIDHDGELVGTCGLNAFDHLDRRANLGYWVRVDRQRRGIATTATLLLRDHALHTLGLQRVEVIMSTRNHASRRVAEAAGAIYEGILRARLHLHGHAHDAHSYSFTKRPATQADITEFDGDRATLRHLFELADDSAREIDRTIHLGQLLVAHLDDTAVGIAHLVPTDQPDTVEVRAIAVADAHQNHGIGRALLDAAITTARHSGHTRLVLATGTADTALLRFYQRHGLRLTRIEPDAFTTDAGYPQASPSTASPCATAPGSTSTCDLRPSMQILPAAPGQIAAVLELWQCADAEPTITDTEQALESLLAFDPDALHVAHCDGAMVGTIIATWDGWRAGFYRLAVHPEHRRRGIATALVRHAEDHLRAKGAARVALIIVADEIPALEFWRTVGYIPQTDRIRHVRNLDPR